MEELEIIDTSGFYRLQDGELQHAPNFVYAPDYSLVREEKDNYTYPVHGWSWFETLDEAEIFFA